MTDTFDEAPPPQRRIRALSLHQPWADIVVHNRKRVENRDWQPDPRMLSVGDFIAIHASGTPHAESWAGAVAHANAHGMIDDIPILAGLRRIELGDAGQRFASHRIKRYCQTACVYGSIVGIARFGGTVTRAEDLPLMQRRWFVGKYGWILHPVVAVAPIRVRGERGLFALNEFVTEQLRLAFQAARKAPHDPEDP